MLNSAKNNLLKKIETANNYEIENSFLINNQQFVKIVKAAFEIGCNSDETNKKSNLNAIFLLIGRGNLDAE